MTEEEYCKRLTMGVKNLLKYPHLSWRDKSVLMLCAYDGEFHSQKAIQKMAKDGSCSVKNAIKNLLEGGYLTRKEVYTHDEMGNKIGQWTNILGNKAKKVLFPDFKWED